MKKIFILMMGVLIIYSCSKKETNELPNILWITCEDISPSWGCYGDEQATTPNIDQLATEGYIFNQAFSNAPICSPARSTLISGMYATSLGTQNLRSDIPVPENFKTLPEILKKKGYYTTNNSKTDYNFDPSGRWDDSSREAHWRNRNANQPFFSVFNFGITHEGPTNSSRPEDTESLDKFHDPDKMEIPPYFPDTKEFRSIIAHQYDLITVFDQEVGKLIHQLKEDGLYDNTIIFVFSDHGDGLPRHKRWLYNTGLQVPFVLNVPENYKNKVANLSSQQVNHKVGFVDFAPTVLNLAEIDAPEMMEGQAFLGQKTKPKEYIFGYRDRADDVYDMSRCIYDGRFLYIRHFMPHKPYIQNAIIFNKGKRSYEELFRVKKEGELPPEAKQMFTQKPTEELYDLKKDPYELNNLVNDSQHMEKVKKLKNTLREKMLKHYDTGLMNEGDMMTRARNAGGISVYEMARDSSLFNPQKVLKAAELVGKINHPKELQSYFNDSDPAIRFWALNALEAFENQLPVYKKQLKKMLGDESIPNRVKAAEMLITAFDDKEAMTVLKEALYTDYEPVLLQVAISVRNLGKKAEPLIPVIKEDIYPKIAGNVWGRYRTWVYPMFIGMSFDQTLINCGEEVNINK